MITVFSQDPNAHRDRQYSCCDRRTALSSIFSVACVWILIGSPSVAHAQLAPAISALLPEAVSVSDSVKPSPLSNDYRLNFAVPDAPAFSLLDNSSSNLLRPSSVKEFAIALSSFVDTASGGFTVPQTFVVEFSPGLLIGGSDLSLKEYQSTPFLYRLRVSAGTRRSSGTGSPSELALGIRTSFIDQSDLRTDPELLNSIVSITNQMVEIATDIVPPPPMSEVEADPGDISGAEIVDLDDSTYAAYESRLEALINASRADERWNATALDLAAAMRLSSGDSTIAGLQTTELAGWLTYATGFGTWGQLMIGGKAGLLRDSVVSADLNFAASLAGRFYLGLNDYKMFCEAAFTARDPGNRLSLNGGGEARITDGLWASFGGGIERDIESGTWSVISDFSVKVGVPFLL